MRPPSVSRALALAALLLWTGCQAPAAVNPAASAPDAARPTKNGIPLASPDEVGFASTAIEQLRTRAQARRTDALLVLKDGQLVIEEYFGAEPKPSVAMSASKSIVSLAVGFLIAEGKMTLDQKASDFLPAWQEDPTLGAITIRHLLTQTSGIDPMRAFDLTTGQLLGLEDHLAGIQAQTEPGQTWLYNNNGVDALSLLAERAAGVSLDDYLDEKLFHPIGAGRPEWMRFADGAPMGAGELVIDPFDLAKVGLLLADGGTREGRVIVDGKFLTESAQPSTPYAPEYGYLWWRNVRTLAWGVTDDMLTYWRAVGISQPILDKVGALVGKEFATPRAALDATTVVLDTTQRTELNDAFKTNSHFPIVRSLRVGPAKGFSAIGWMGQILFVYPERHLVAVRMHYPTDEDYGDSPPNTEYSELQADILALIGEQLD
jgi:CubicO group peptidase (beta-lactamase class C family)